MINSHSLNKIKTNGDGSMKLKARVARYGIENRLGEEFSKDYTVWLSPKFGIVEYIASLKTFTVYKADVKPPFLQTDAAYRHIYTSSRQEKVGREAVLLAILDDIIRSGPFLR